MTRYSVRDFLNAKQRGEKIPMVTAYDRLTAVLAEKGGINSVLVGDSLGTAVLGYDDTIPVTMQDMISHTRAVVRSTSHCMVVADMPFLSYNTSSADAVLNAGKLIAEGGAGAVKMEGGQNIESVISAVVAAGIPVMAHIGYTPQSILAFGGHKAQGGDEKTARKVIADALAVERAGAFAVVLECVPYILAKEITGHLSIPTIGIGSGADCSGQVLVIHDILGLSGDFKPRHVKRYIDGEELLGEQICKYVKEVANGEFPKPENSFKINEDALTNIKKDGIL